MPNVLDRITINPAQCGGRPCIRGMRIRVIDVLDLLAAGSTWPNPGFQRMRRRAAEENV